MAAGGLADSASTRKGDGMAGGPPAAVLKIPPGVAHGCKAIGGVSHLFYVTSSIYDPKEEGRIAHDDPSIGYDWLAGPTIK